MLQWFADFFFLIHRIKKKCGLKITPNYLNNLILNSMQPQYRIHTNVVPVL